MGTGRGGNRYGGMDGERRIWLINNSFSGSNTDTALQALETCCGEHGFRVAHRTVFPAQELPTPAMLDAAGIEEVAVFTGDGTLHAALDALAGWGGAVLVLPGGTMNMLYHRLHGDRTAEEVIAAVAGGEAERRRPAVINSALGYAYTGILAGPGASWGRVREAMRDASVVELAAGTAQAIEETLGGEMIACAEPALGRREGYPLIMLTPRKDRIEVTAYRAETPREYLDQAWALLRRNFREGPHEVLGHGEAVRLASTQGNPFGVLIDGEQASAPPEADFRLAACRVELLATEPDAP